MGEDAPILVAGFFGIDADHDALAAELLRALADQWRVGDSRGVDAHLVGACLEHRTHVIHRANATADGERHEALVARTLDDIDDRFTFMRAGGDVEEHHLISTLAVVFQRQLHRIAHIAQFARLRFAKLHTTGHLPIMDVQTRNDTLGQHRWAQTSDAEEVSRVKKRVYLTFHANVREKAQF